MKLLMFVNFPFFIVRFCGVDIFYSFFDFLLSLILFWTYFGLFHFNFLNVRLNTMHSFSISFLLIIDLLLTFGNRYVDAKERCLTPQRGVF